MIGNTIRPAVSIQTLARSAKAVVSDRNAASARNGLRRGTVTRRKRRYGLFDSSTAHSNNSGGMAFRPARRRTPTNELPRHTLNSATLKSAHAPVPRRPSTLPFSWPRTTLYAVGTGGLRLQYHPITLTPAGYAHGRKTARKTRARPRNGRASSRAKPRPRSSFTTLVTSAYATVAPAAHQNAGSARCRR